MSAQIKDGAIVISLLFKVSSFQFLILLMW